jgi:hypothetical protein
VRGINIKGHRSYKGGLWSNKEREKVQVDG